MLVPAAPGTALGLPKKEVMLSYVRMALDGIGDLAYEFCFVFLEASAARSVALRLRDMTRMDMDRGGEVAMVVWVWGREHDARLTRLLWG